MNDHIALLPEGASTALRVPRDRMRPDPSQPRKHFDKVSLQELADSIGEVGQMKPVELRRLPKGDTHDFEIIDGERRWLACGMNGTEELFALVYEVKDPEEKFIRSVVANFGREGHTPLETARAITKILEGKRLESCANRTEKIAKVARMFAKSPAWIYMHLNILNLHPEVLALMEPSVEEAKRIGFSIGVFLNTITDKELQLEIAKEVSEKGLKLRQARHLARKKAEAAGLTAGTRERRPSDHFKALERFIDVFNVNSEEIMDMPMSSFEAVYGRRSPAQQRKIIKNIDAMAERLQELRMAFERAGRRGQDGS